MVAYVLFFTKSVPAMTLHLPLSIPAPNTTKTGASHSKEKAETSYIAGLGIGLTGRQVQRKPRRTPRLHPTTLQLTAPSSIALHILAARPRPPHGPRKMEDWACSEVSGTDRAETEIARASRAMTKVSLNILLRFVMRT